MSRKYSYKSRGRPRKNMSKKSRRCKNLLKKKIEINLKEYGKGKYVSRSQAIAVSYSQVKKKNPSCSRYFRVSRTGSRGYRKKILNKRKSRGRK
jgi:hypothetical protein